MNKDELEFESGVFRVALLLLPIIPSSEVRTQLLLPHPAAKPPNWRDSAQHQC